MTHHNQIKVLTTWFLKFSLESPEASPCSKRPAPLPANPFGPCSPRPLSPTSGWSRRSHRNAAHRRWPPSHAWMKLKWSAAPSPSNPPSRWRRPRLLLPCSIFENRHLQWALTIGRHPSALLLQWPYKRRRAHPILPHIILNCSMLLLLSPSNLSTKLYPHRSLSTITGLASLSNRSPKTLVRTSESSSSFSCSRG
jgi:hypothetical protein